MREGTLDDLLPGAEVAGKYRVLRLIGEGGMGLVYAARRTNLDDVVAMKLLRPEQSSATHRARFLREARALARIRHPNVVQVFDFGELEDGRPYMVMEYLHGPTLERTLREKGKLVVDRALEIFDDICRAVEAGHRRGVVHRDLKPGNVILARNDDGTEVVKVLDFGLARFTESEGSVLTKAGALLGTCAYMAPEQIENAEGTAASDVFGLAVMLYEMVTGKLPFQAANQIATIMKITDGEFIPVHSVDPNLPRELVLAIESSLVIDPLSRPAGAWALAALARGEEPDTLPPVSREDPMEEAGGWSSSGSGTGGASSDATAPPPDEGATLNVEKTPVTKVAPPSVAPVSSSDDEMWIGRGAELEHLQAEFAACRPGEAHLAVVLGEAGVGKTALMERFGSWAAKTKKSVMLRGRFYAYEGDRPPPYETYLWMLGGESGEGLAAEARPGGADERLGSDKWRAFGRIAQAFAKRAQGKTLVLGLDDLQWATALDLDFLTYLMRGTPGLALMVVATARSSDARADARSELARWLSGLGSHRHRSTTSLAPFTLDEVRQLLDARFEGLVIRPGDVRRLARSTGGNPAMLAEVLRHLVASGVIKRGRDGWSCRRIDSDAMPASLTALVSGTLAELPSEIRQVVENACVVGEELRFETLQEATGLEEDELEERLEAGVKAGILSDRKLSPGADYRFSSATTRGAIYDGLSKRKRRRYHRNVVSALERLYGKDRERIAKVLCYHYHAIGDWDATLRWGLIAAGETLRRYDADNAAAALERTQEAADALVEEGESPSDEEALQLDLLTGTWGLRMGNTEDALVSLRRAEARAANLGDVGRRVDALLQLAKADTGRGELDAALGGARRASEFARQAEDVRRELAARLEEADVLARLGRYDESRLIVDEVVRGTADAAPESAPSEPDLRGRLALHSLALRLRAWIATRTGQLAEASKDAAAAREAALASGDPLAEYFAVSVQAIVDAEGGSAEDAIGSYREALRMARAMSLRRREMIELANLAMSLLDLGRADEAVASMLKVTALCRELGDRASEGDARVGLGRALVARGDVDEGLGCLERGAELCRAAGRAEYAGWGLCDAAWVYLERGDLDRARRLLSDVAENYADVATAYMWRVRLGLGRVALEDGDIEAASEHLKAAERLVAETREGSGDQQSPVVEAAARSVRDLKAELRARQRSA